MSCHVCNREVQSPIFFINVNSLVCPQVTYRVVQVTDDQLEATADATGAVSVVSTAAFAGAPQAVAQVSKHTVRLQQVLGCNNLEQLWQCERRKTYTAFPYSVYQLLYYWLADLSLTPPFPGCYPEPFQQWEQSWRRDCGRRDTFRLFPCRHHQRWNSHGRVGAGHRRTNDHTGRR